MCFFVKSSDLRGVHPLCTRGVQGQTASNILFTPTLQEIVYTVCTGVFRECFFERSGRFRVFIDDFCRKICQNLSKFVKICQKFCQNLSKFVKICQNFSKFVKNGQNEIFFSSLCNLLFSLISR